eukprot:TRINITY_DN23409_c1_g3_i1.p1 TRINITY_DN23409_c1_g3~~TRINITY_DN23409_c1_g3_i1.p1  ORF type:complete len:625 (-),score=89.05 TRINITY_DN23409_c1_g3_i1:204-2024(-)
MSTRYSEMEPDMVLAVSDGGNLGSAGSASLGGGNLVPFVGGGAAVLVVLSGCAWLIHRRRRRRQVAEQELATMQRHLRNTRRTDSAPLTFASSRSAKSGLCPPEDESSAGFLGQRRDFSISGTFGSSLTNSSRSSIPRDGVKVPVVAMSFGGDSTTSSSRTVVAVDSDEEEDGIAFALDSGGSPQTKAGKGSSFPVPPVARTVNAKAAVDTMRGAVNRVVAGNRFVTGKVAKDLPLASVNPASSSRVAPASPTSGTLAGNINSVTSPKGASPAKTTSETSAGTINTVIAAQGASPAKTTSETVAATINAVTAAEGSDPEVVEPLVQTINTITAAKRTVRTFRGNANAPNEQDSEATPSSESTGSPAAAPRKWQTRRRAPTRGQCRAAMDMKETVEEEAPSQGQAQSSVDTKESPREGDLPAGSLPIEQRMAPFGVRRKYQGPKAQPWRKGSRRFRGQAGSQSRSASPSDPLKEGESPGETSPPEDGGKIRMSIPKEAVAPLKPEGPGDRDKASASKNKDGGDRDKASASKNKDGGDRDKPPAPKKNDGGESNGSSSDSVMFSFCDTDPGTPAPAQPSKARRSLKKANINLKAGHTFMDLRAATKDL